MLRAGIDIGSIFLKIVLIDEDQRLVREYYTEHGNDPLGCLIRELPDSVNKVAITGSDPEYLERVIGAKPLNLFQCLICQVAYTHPQTSHIVDIGANSSTLINLRDGKYVSSKQNSICSAGTGSFLDEQMKRLELSYDRFAEMRMIEEPPSIATRCGVFAKSDLIHRQQEGCSRDEMWAGVCKSMLLTSLNSLFRGNGEERGTILCGGVALNPQIRYYLGRLYAEGISVYDTPHLTAALGAARLAWKNETFQDVRDVCKKQDNRSRDLKSGRKLILEKSIFPTFAVFEESVDSNGNQIRISIDPKKMESPLDVVIGMDIGSTSTKAAIIAGRDIYLDVYGKTNGDPVGAAKKVLTAVFDFFRRKGINCRVRGFGTTGSGRSIIGNIFKADLVINEITAHAKAAKELFPGTRTIFEIGGQDSKYTLIEEGNVRDVNMNFVCAAGTGSFIEEQCQKLDIRVEDVGDMMMGITPPATSKRCTVFMEQDINILLARGYGKPEIMASVMYSVVENYLSKVVGNRRIDGESILFQGATARNKGLVAAFEQVTNKKIVVAPYCHVMGAYGAALLALEELHGKAKSSFIGHHVVDRDIRLREKTCDLCTNRCRIKKAEIDGDADSEIASWGYKCGREPDGARKKNNPYFSPFVLRDALFEEYSSFKCRDVRHFTIGIPRTLQAHFLFPFWSAFFHALKCEVKLSPQTDAEIISMSNSSSSVDFCLPGKISIGHVRKLLEDASVDFIFQPAILESPRKDGGERSWFCPITTAQPYYASVNGGTTGAQGKIIACCLNFNWNRRSIMEELYSALHEKLCISRDEIGKAWDRATVNQNGYMKRCQEEGQKVLSALKANGDHAFAIIGRPYNLFDYGLNLDIPRIISQYGYTVVPLELIPCNEKTIEQLKTSYNNMYWSYGLLILNAAEYIRTAADIHAVYFTNFNCGPDSFIMTFFEKLMAGKPMLILELDEHNSAGGYLTRIEAFIDVIRRRGEREFEKYRHDMEVLTMSEIRKDTKILFPLAKSQMQSSVMHLTKIFPIIFEKMGYRCEYLNGITRENYEIARSYTRGSECCPALAVLGSLLEHLRGTADIRFYVGMMTGHGPCRFGQYIQFYHTIFKSLGLNVKYINIKRGTALKDSASRKMKLDVFKGIVAIDILKKYLHRIRPYEVEKGSAKRVFDRYEDEIYKTIREDRSLEKVIARMSREFEAIPLGAQKKKLVGIVGEIFVRQEEFINEYLIDEIEKYGGEAWLMPLSDWFLEGANRDLIDEIKSSKRSIARVFRRKITLHVLERIEKRMMKRTGRLLDRRHEPGIRAVFREGAKYLSESMPLEDLPNIGRAVIFSRRDRVDLIVNVKPFSCMPGNIVESLLKRIEREHRLPILSLSYEGGYNTNRPIRSILENL